MDKVQKIRLKKMMKNRNLRKRRIKDLVCGLNSGEYIVVKGKVIRNNDYKVNNNG